MLIEQLTENFQFLLQTIIIGIITGFICGLIIEITNRAK